MKLDDLIPKGPYDLTTDHELVARWTEQYVKESKKTRVFRITRLCWLVLAFLCLFGSFACFVKSGTFWIEVALPLLVFFYTTYIIWLVILAKHMKRLFIFRYLLEGVEPEIAIAKAKTDVSQRLLLVSLRKYE